MYIFYIYELFFSLFQWNGKAINTLYSMLGSILLSLCEKVHAKSIRMTHIAKFPNNQLLTNECYQSLKNNISKIQSLNFHKAIKPYATGKM